MVIGYKPRKPIDLPLPIDNQPRALAESFAQHLHDLQDDIRWQIAVSNDYKSVTDLHKRLQ